MSKVASNDHNWHIEDESNVELKGWYERIGVSRVSSNRMTAPSSSLSVEFDTRTLTIVI
jgi:hypothetical protein